MKQIFIYLFLIFLIIFSGCSSSSSSGGFSFFGSKSKTPEVDRTGQGLLVNFETKEQFLSVRQLDYTLTLENTGVEPVVLKKENVKLYTPIAGEIVLDKTSVDNLYNNIFKGGESISIVHDQKISGIIGPLFIDNDFFTKKTRENFEYILDIKYDYKTKFSNNLEIDFKSSNLLKIMDSVSQAAPVQVTKIELSPISINEYAIKYYLSDKGQSSSDIRSIKLKNIQIQFRTQELGSACKGLTYKDGVYKDVGIDSLVISKETPEVIVACKVDVSDLDKTTKMITTTSGSFEYEYNIKVKQIVTLPKKSGDQIIWQ